MMVQQEAVAKGIVVVKTGMFELAVMLFVAP
jgi:hypothetical protein